MIEVWNPPLEPMLDFDKIKRFEEMFEKHNQSIELAKFWNELEPVLLGTTKYIEDLEQTIMEQSYRHSRLIRITKNTFKWLKIGTNSISQIRRLPNGG